jgi:ABC-type antimicrobial peptide transport system permease subunit
LDDSGNVKRVDLKTKIGAVVTAEREMPFYGDSDYVFAVRQSAIDGSFSSGYQYIDMRLRSQNDYSETEDVIRRIAGLHSGDDDLGIVSSRKYNAEKRQAVMLVTVIGGLIVASATVYALLTLTSVLRSSVYERKRIWGYLKAAGMQHKEALMLERVTTAAVIAISFLAALLLGGIFALSMDTDECIYINLAGNRSRLY